MTPKPTTVARPWEAVVLVSLCFGWAIFRALEVVADGFRTRPFTDQALWETAGLEIALAVLAFAFLKWRRWLLAEFIPHPTALGCGIGVLLYVAASWTSWIAVAPIYEPAMLQPLRDLMPRQRPAVSAVVFSSMVNGLYEETFLLAYLIRGFRGRGIAFALGLSLLVRVSYHLYQGPLGAFAVLGWGFLLSVYYWRFGLLWPPVFAHILADIFPFT